MNDKTLLLDSTRDNQVLNHYGENVTREPISCFKVSLPRVDKIVPNNYYIIQLSLDIQKPLFVEIIGRSVVGQSHEFRAQMYLFSSASAVNG